MRYSLITADVHLQPDDSHPINQAFYQFLATEAPKADALYLLGDVFEMWVGDDLGCVTYATVIEKFKQLTDNGLPIYLLYGNRDFLMRERFWQATGIQQITEPYTVELYGKPLLMMHGDALCTDDKAFQRARFVLRSALVTWLFLKLPPNKRLSIGENMRAKSQRHNLNKAENIMDVNQQAVEKIMQKYQCNDLIHGHTHRPQHHSFNNPATTNNRWVLGDWRPEAQLLKITEQQSIEWITFDTKNQSRDA